MYEMMKIRGKPPLHGGAAFGVAWKELMPSLKNAWNSEAYNEDLRTNRKVYEKSAAALAAADDSEPVPPLRLRAVLLDISSRINTLLGSVTGATSEIDTNMNNGDPADVDLSAMSTEWNELVSYLNPLVIGPVNVGMNDEDTNQLHSMVTNQLLQPLMMLQEKAFSYERWGGPIVNREVILSNDIARNIMLQVKDKYYKAVPYGEERRPGPGMGPRPYDDDDDDEDERPFEGPAAYVPGIDEGEEMVDWREPYEDQGPGPYGFQNPRRQGREMPNQPGELRFPEGFARRPIRMEGREGFGDYERGPLPEQDDPNVRLANARERMRGRLAERRQQDADVREIWVDDDEEPYGGEPEPQQPPVIIENPAEAQRWTAMVQRVLQDDRAETKQFVRQAKAYQQRNRDNWARIISEYQRKGKISTRQLAKANDQAKQMGKMARQIASMMDDVTEAEARLLNDGSEPRFAFNRDWQIRAGFDPNAPPDSSETVALSPSPAKPKDGRPTPRRLLPSPSPSESQFKQMVREATPARRAATPARRAETPARAPTPARRAETPALQRPRQESASDMKRRVLEEKQKATTPDKRSAEPQRGFLRSALGWLVGQNLLEGDRPRAVVPFASPLPEPPKGKKEKRAKTPQPPPAAAKRVSQKPEVTTYNKKGQPTTKPAGKGRWTDYNGPMPTAVRSYGSGSAGAKDPKKQRGSENDPLYFHDDDNDVCETGEVTQPDEMTHTEIREAHLDPDWKGLPKRWGQERRYKKLRKGYGIPKENY
jgi:hypothetical protein